MQFKVCSLRFKAELQRRQREFARPNIRIHMSVPPSMMWWHFVEYGTGSRGEGGGADYTIQAVLADALRFYHEGKPIVVDQVQHPGITPHHMIGDIWEDCQEIIRSAVAAAMVSYDYDALREAVQSAAQKVKEAIIESFALRLPGNESTGTRKLHGESAADVFGTNLEINDLT